MSETNEKFTNVYINNIDPCISSVDLKEICERYGGRVVSAIIIKERGVSLGYGFCNFASHEEAVHAVEEMNNLFIMGKRLAVSRAASKADRAKFLRSVHTPSDRPGENANVYVKNLDYGIDEEALRGHFRPFGPIINVRIMRDDIGNSKGYGFVSYARHADAVKAVRALNGLHIGKLAIHVDFYEPKKGRKMQAAQRVSVSAPASPVESFSKTKPSASASALVTPTQSKAPSPLVIPSSIEESAFYCGTPISHDEVSDIDRAAAAAAGGGSETPNVDEAADADRPTLLVIEKKMMMMNRGNNVLVRDNDYDEEEEEENGGDDNTKPLISVGTAPAMKGASARGMDNGNVNYNSDTMHLISARMNWNPSGVVGGVSNEDECHDMPKISQLIERQCACAGAAGTTGYRENEIKVHGLRYLSNEKDVLRLFYDFECVGARPALNARGIRTGEWYVTFARRLDAERALAMCNDECFVVRGCKVRAERVPLVERPAAATAPVIATSTFPAFPAFRFVKKGLLFEENQQQEEAYGTDYGSESYEFPSLMNDMSIYSDFSHLYC